MTLSEYETLRATGIPTAEELAALEAIVRAGPLLWSELHAAQCPRCKARRLERDASLRVSWCECGFAVIDLEIAMGRASA